MERPIAITLASVWTSNIVASGAQLLFAGSPNESWIIPGIIWSFYDNSPTNADDFITQIVSVNDYPVTHEYFNFGITNRGPGFFNFPRPIKFPRGTGVVFNITTVGGVWPTNHIGTIGCIGAYLE